MVTDATIVSGPQFGSTESFMESDFISAKLISVHVY